MIYTETYMYMHVHVYLIFNSIIQYPCHTQSYIINNNIDLPLYNNIMFKHSCLWTVQLYINSIYFNI